MTNDASSNARVLIDRLISDQWSESDTAPSPDTAFEIFACQQVLKRYNLSTDEIRTGIVGGSDDGGIDGVYTFVGEQLLTEDAELFDDNFTVRSIGQHVPIKLQIIQAKRSTSFTETTLDLASSSLSRLLNLELSEDELRGLYSQGVVSQFSLFRQALELLAVRHPDVAVEFTYAARGDADKIHAKVHKKAHDLQDQLATIVTGADGVVTFVGANELWRSASSNRGYTLQLTYQENATRGTSHVALVSLGDYVTFLTDELGDLRRHIFDWNVRDYQGGVEVNREIQRSLSDPNAPDFWWLNNGVTIICTRVSIQGKTYTLDDVQIVNGLQTSYATFLALQDLQPDAPVLSRSLLVRILETGDEDTRDRIIRATNRQTSIPVASLRATDEIQRKVEAYFEVHGWYYDRRKNYYRNIGKPLSRIIGIPFLAQAVMALGLSRPDDARARPSSLLKSDADYVQIFSDDTPLNVYLWAARAQKEVDAFLQSSLANATALERTNLRFHLSMLAAARLMSKPVVEPRQLQAFADDDTSLADAGLLSCLNELRKMLMKRIADSAESMDKIAKGRQFVESILAELPEPPQDGDTDQP